MYRGAIVLKRRHVQLTELPAELTTFSFEKYSYLKRKLTEKKMMATQTWVFGNFS